MPELTALQPSVELIEFRSTPQDWTDAAPAMLGSMLASSHIIRAFEEKVLELSSQGLINGPAHSAIGQEGGAVGSAEAMRASDQVNGSHRAHHQFLAKSLRYVAPDGISPLSDFMDGVEELAQRSLAEILGLAQGFCKGRGGSMHLRWEASGNLGTNAIVGGGVPMAAGAAWAHKRSGTGDVVFTYFGDGAANIGSVLETMNLAAAWKLPICFFIENNQYAVATSVAEATGEARLSARGMGFGIPAWKVDGMDPLAVKLVTDHATQIMRQGGGATIIEADVYRYFHQSGHLPGSAFGYRSKSEETAWRQRDPLDRLANEMIERQLISSQAISDLRARSQVMIDRIAERLLEDADGHPRIRPALWPDEGFRDYGIRGDLSELDDVRVEEIETFKGEVKPAGKFMDTIAAVIQRRMEQDSSVIILGEDVHRLRGGTNGATRGVIGPFPDRVLGTPISENAFTGLAGGMAMDGRYRPIIEFMYPDFMWVAADQVFNQVGKARHMFGGDSVMPLVLRTKVAIGSGYGSQHSMDPAGIFATSPGWRIVAPTTPFDYVGLFNSALRCLDPVLIIEHVDLYNSTGPAPADDLDYFIPFGKAKLVRNGKQATIITYLGMVRHVVEQVDALGIDADVIDLRSLDRAGLDWETIEASVRKTGNVLVVEQGALGTSYGSILSDEIQRRCFDWLDQPVQRVHGSEASPSVSRALERVAHPGPLDLAKALQSLIANQGRSLS